MRDAHPMLQPTDWSVPPEALAGEIPARRRAVYRLIWDAAIACMLKPPTLQHERWVFHLDAGALGWARRTAGSEAPGYWRVRQDWPASRWPITEQAPGAGEYEVVALVAVQQPVATISALLVTMEREAIATAASAADLLRTLSGAEGSEAGGRWPAAMLAITRDVDGLPVELTDAGFAQLQAIEDTGLGHDASEARRRAELLDKLTAGQLSSREALTGTPGLTEVRLAGLCDAIEAAVLEWEGTRRPTLDEIDARSAIPPLVAGFPSGMDPDALLPVDHPLRDYRAAMELALASEDRFWRSRVPLEQARCRWAWLVAHPPAGLTPEALTAESARFSALVRWLIGMSPFQDWNPEVTAKASGR